MNDEDNYDWAADLSASWFCALATLRERYLEQRLPGESAEDWLERTSNM
jgi:hypothetical protein|tara:strand:- start:605 stop:751 length:147 start_codon:yes stop_codon:yes gene_type:complete